MSISNENNVKKEIDVTRRLTWLEMDRNFDEIKKSIKDSNLVKSEADVILGSFVSAADVLKILSLDSATIAKNSAISADNSEQESLTSKQSISGALQPANNLSDVPNKVTARTNLGLGTAATQGDTKYNFRSNNLSDLANPTTARNNLGLGTSAIQPDAKYNARVNNLQDVLNKPVARTNLGLGTSATQSDVKYNFRSNNLLDVPNKATARNNLGLGTSATQSDVKYNFRSNNLLDVPNKSIARTNLGLGTSATTNIGKAVGQVPIYENVGGVPTINAPANGLRMGGQLVGPNQTGTWTPKLSGEVGDTFTAVYSNQFGIYTRRGDLVYAKFRIAVDSYSGSINSLLITGVPVPILSTQSFYTGIFRVINAHIPTNFRQWVGETIIGNAIRLTIIDDTANAFNKGESILTPGVEFHGSLTYIAA